MEELDEHAYDRFNLKVTDVQVIFASREDDWHKARKEGPGQLHLLQPVTLDVVLMKSVVPDDTRLPKFVSKTNIYNINDMIGTFQGEVEW